MLRRRQINADLGGRALRPLWTAAAEVLRDAGGFLEEHLLWPVADLLRGRAEILRWPFERFAWLVERRLVWPLQERTAGHSPSSRAAGAGALAAVALAAVALGVLSISGGDSDRGTAVSPIAVRTATAPAQPAPAEPDGPALEGFPPSFGTGGVAAAGGDSDQVTIDSSIPGATADPVATGAAEGAAATSSSEKPVPAGPAAMKVARRFAEAFVFYEVGERPVRAATVFSETATPRLATALAERPPRLPENARVPKARVLNLVPGPRRGTAYTVSASLLRVGVTSELRLQMKRQTGNWVVTDVRG